MMINFIKMHGLGNDFVVIDMITQSFKLQHSHIKRIADRHLGIGCDQVIIIEPPLTPTKDFFYRIFNADGFEVEQCGNGARAAARFFYDSGFTNNRILSADCLAGPVKFKIEEDETVTLNMGAPIFNPLDVPFEADEETQYYPLIVEDERHDVAVLSMGNPHAILRVPELDFKQFNKLGPLISRHPRFPNGTNVSFMKIDDRSNIQLRVYERGVGKTLSCGSAAAAAVVSGIRSGLLENKVDVHFSTGILHVFWEGNHKEVYQRGPATSVFLGRFRL